jgi:glycosyltransferase involved in cell wall biosynthesis
LKKTVLMLCYFFPPLGGGGVQRSLQFAKYLPEFDWDPVVISVVPNRRNTVEQSRDDSSVREIDGRTVVYRTESRELASLYAVLHRLGLRKLLFESERLLPNMQQDYKQGWLRPALRLARQLLSSGGGRTVVYSSAPPYSAHRVGLRLHESAAMPWVADYRDPLTLRTSYRPGTPMQRWIDTRLDRAVVAGADALIANTETDGAAFIERFGVPRDRVHVIPNGFDPEDFAPSAAATTRAGPDSSGFRVTCVGKFYEMTDPHAFFRAFRRFSAAHPDASLRFLAPLTRATLRAAEGELNGVDWSVRDRVPHDEAVREMKSSAVLLANLTQEWIHPVPGKLYEYLAARRPMLFIGRGDGDAAALIRRAGAGEITGFDEKSMLEGLESLYSRYRQSPGDFEPRDSVIQEFDRRDQVRRLATIFDSVTDSRSR